MKQLIIGLCGIVVLCHQAQAHEVRAYCYSGDNPGAANPLECYKVWAFEEDIITWNNRPEPGVLVATVNSTVWGCWYSFSSPALDQYIDSCVTNQHPICLRMKRQVQGGQPSYAVWEFYEKETGSPACQLVYNSQTYTPPTEDARVFEYDPDHPYNATYLWVCNYASPQRQEFFLRFNTPLGVEEKINPNRIRFLRATPNPFSSVARISYNLIAEDVGKLVILSVYDIAGNSVKKLVDTKGDIGYYEVVWNGKDANGNWATPGCYFYRLKVGEHTLTTKTLLIR